MTRAHISLIVHLVRGGAVAAALLMVTILTIGRSQAAFSATTDSSANSFATGTVVLTDDDSGSAMFNVTDMSPGSPVVECITVTYSGTQLPAPVRIYGSSTGTLDTYLDTTIEIGTGGSFGNCAGFTPSSTLFNNTLANFTTTHTNWASGLATFSAAANPTTRTFRFTVDVQNNVAAQGDSSTAVFTFETQA
ncbi:MAG: TasA family protein [Acidimicrobiales bacterium]